MCNQQKGTQEIDNFSSVSQSSQSAVFTNIQASPLHRAAVLGWAEAHFEADSRNSGDDLPVLLVTYLFRYSILKIETYLFDIFLGRIWRADVRARATEERRDEDVEPRAGRDIPHQVGADQGRAGGHWHWRRRPRGHWEWKGTETKWVGPTFPKRAAVVCM